MALGIWGAIGGVAVAIGPLIGGAITTGWAWQYIFWINVPVGLALAVLAYWRLAEFAGSRPNSICGACCSSASDSSVSSMAWSRAIPRAGPVPKW